MENKKIRNTKKTSSFGIQFKSQIESMIYRTLLDNGILPQYEARTFVLSPKIRPTEPFYNRFKGEYKLDMKPIQPITYTPDFTFEYEGFLIIVEVKGLENDVFPVKRNLFRKYLETLEQPSMFFEVRTKREMLIALRIMRLETMCIHDIRKLIVKLPEKDIPIGNKLLENRSFEDLQTLVDSAISKIEKARESESNKYDNIDLDSLYELQAAITTVII